jgi:hypothetical protein
MIPLDVSGAGLFGSSSQFLHIVAEALKLIAGSFAIVLFTGVSIIAAVVFAIYRAVQRSSVTLGVRLLLRLAGYVAGAFIALFFALIAATIFSISALKLLLIAAVILFITSFLVQEFILFFIFKRFGKYIFYVASIKQIHKTIFNGEEKN